MKLKQLSKKLFKNNGPSIEDNQRNFRNTFSVTEQKKGGFIKIKGQEKE